MMDDLQHQSAVVNVGSGQILISNGSLLDESIVRDLSNASQLNEDEIIKRLRQIYVQADSGIGLVVERFKSNDYDVLKTIKSFYSDRLTELKPKQSQSTNQTRMRQIRNYMNEREKIKTKQMSPK